MLRAVESRGLLEWQDMMLPFPQEHGQGGDRVWEGGVRFLGLTVSGRNYWKTLESTTSIRNGRHFLKK